MNIIKFCGFLRTAGGPGILNNLTPCKDFNTILLYDFSGIIIQKISSILIKKLGFGTLLLFMVMMGCGAGGGVEGVLVGELLQPRCPRFINPVQPGTPFSVQAGWSSLNPAGPKPHNYLRKIIQTMRIIVCGQIAESVNN